MANSTRKTSPRRAKPAAAATPAPAPPPMQPAPASQPPRRRSPWTTVGIVVGALAILAVVFGAGGVIGYGFGRAGSALGVRSFAFPFLFRMQPYGGMMRPYGERGQPNDGFGWMPHDRLGPLAAGAAYLGVRYGEVDPSRASEEGLNPGEGAAVSAVVQDSPADQAGLQSGDIILEVDDLRLTRAKLLSRLIQAHAPGDEVTLLVLHNGEQVTLMVVLGQGPIQPPQ